MFPLFSSLFSSLSNSLSPFFPLRPITANMRNQLSTQTISCHSELQIQFLHGAHFSRAQLGMYDNKDQRYDESLLNILAAVKSCVGVFMCRKSDTSSGCTGYSWKPYFPKLSHHVVHINRVLQRSGKKGERLFERLEKRLEKRGNT